MHAEAYHGLSVTHPAGFTDGAVGLRFMLEDEWDSLSLNFADLEFKQVHAGHLFVVNLSPAKVQIMDMKSGGMRIDIREARVAKQALNAEQKLAIQGKDKSFPHALEPGKWHDVIVKVSGDTVSVRSIAKRLATMAHPTKRMLRLGVPRTAVVDDVKIWRRK